jgi:outer membrane protein assembly factor BamB
MLIPNLSLDLFPSHLAVVPILIGPLQVLITLLPALLAGIGGFFFALFKPSTAKKTVKLLWKQKFACLVIVGVVGGGFYLIRTFIFNGNRSVSAVENSTESWSMFRGDPQRQGRSGNGPDPLQSGINWAFSTEAKTFLSAPAIAGNRVYISSADKGVFTDSGSIYCLDADTGGVVWKSAPKNYRATYSSPVVSGKYLVCGEGLHYTDKARIVCLNRESGEVLWEHEVEGHHGVEATPCIYKDKVYVGGGYDGFYCIALEPESKGRPKIVWRHPAKNYPDTESSAAVYNGKIYFGLGIEGNAICCVDAETGKEEWRCPTPYPVFCHPTIVQDKLFIGMGNGDFINSAEEVREKNLKKLKEEGKSQAELEEASKRLAPGGEVWCLNAITGKKEWSLKTDETILGAIIASENRLYFACRNGAVYALTLAGGPIAKWHAHESVMGSPALGQQHIYFVSTTGKLFCLNAEDLQLVWQKSLGSGDLFISSPTIARGHLYIGTSQDGFLCIGNPGNTKKESIWAGILGGPGRAGSIDGSSLPSRGKLLWQYPVAEENASSVENTNSILQTVSIASPAASCDDMVYVSRNTGSKKGVVGLKNQKSRTPEELWVFETPNLVTLSPAVIEKQVFFVDGIKGDSNRNLFCVGSNGNEMWRKEIGPDASGEFVVSPSGLLIEDRDQTISLIDLKGGIKWSQKLGALIGSPCYKDMILSVTLQDPAALVSLDLLTGAELWRRELSSPPKVGPAVRKDRIYVGTQTGISTFKLLDGSPVWSMKEGSVEKPFILGSDFVSYVSSAGELLIVNLEDGVVRQRVPNALASVPPLSSGDTLLYASTDGLTSYKLSDSTSKKWMTTDWLGDISSPMIMADSKIYFGTTKLGLVCVGDKK